MTERLGGLETEGRAAALSDLDLRPTLEIVHAVVTAQKLVLNAFSTAVMVRRGRTLGDLMTSMRVANAPASTSRSSAS